MRDKSTVTVQPAETFVDCMLRNGCTMETLAAYSEDNKVKWSNLSSDDVHYLVSLGYSYSRIALSLHTSFDVIVNLYDEPTTLEMPKQYFKRLKIYKAATRSYLRAGLQYRERHKTDNYKQIPVALQNIYMFYRTSLRYVTNALNATVSTAKVCEGYRNGNITEVDDVNKYALLIGLSLDELDVNILGKFKTDIIAIGMILYHAGNSVADICKTLDIDSISLIDAICVCTDEVIWRTDVLLALGGQSRKELFDIILSQYKNGKSVDDILSFSNFSRDEVVKFLVRKLLPIQMREDLTSTPIAKRFKRKKPIDVSGVLALRKAGWDVKKIADEKRYTEREVLWALAKGGKIFDE